jgi:predicted NBD/HSP70 family sugar kinase
MSYTIGVELVGSQIRAALLRTDLAAPRDKTVPAADLEYLRGKPWPKDIAGKIVNDPNQQIDEIVNISKELVESAQTVAESDIQGIGVAIVPAVDRHTGNMVATDAYKAHPIDFKVPLAEKLNKEFGNIKVEVYNRSQAGAWGEYKFGLGSDGLVMDNLAYITVSYYNNLGMIIDGKLYGGSRGFAGQFAHMAVNPMGPRCPACYQHGCIWVLASGFAIARDFAEKYVLEQKGEAVLARIQERRPEDTGRFDLGGTYTVSIDGQEITIDGRAVLDAAQHGDPEASDIVIRAGTYLGRGVGHIINMINPDVVALGGIAARSDVMREAIVEEAKSAAISVAWASTSVQNSQHDDRTPIIGAALLARP